MTRTMCALFLTALPFLACSTTGEAERGEVDEEQPEERSLSRRERSVLKRASFDMDCDEDELELYRLSALVSGARGCGRQAAYIVRCDIFGICKAVLNSDVVSLEGTELGQDEEEVNNAGRAERAVRTRAGFDLRCGSYRVVDLGTQTYGASGCGRKATYTVECMIDGCTAYMDSQSVP